MADTIHYSVTGQFSSNIGITSLTSPNANFSLDFDILNGPVVNATVVNSVFTVQFAANVNFVVAGTPRATSNHAVSFYQDVALGGFSIFLYDVPNSVELNLNFSSPQLFTSNVENTQQTLLTGSFPVAYGGDSFAQLGSNFYDFPTGNANIIVTQLADPIVPTVPEPGTMALGGLALAGLVVYKRSRK
jgi:hypothetical protein